MAAIEIIKSSGKCYCRGSQPNCAYTRGKITKGAPALRIQARGTPAFYCIKCMDVILEQARKALFDATQI